MFRDHSVRSPSPPVTGRARNMRAPMSLRALSCEFGEQVAVDPQRDRRVVVTEILGQLDDRRPSATITEA
jgi:hypothetical protein